VGVHRDSLYRRLRTLRTNAEAAYRGQHGPGGVQLPLQKQVRRMGLPGTSTFEGKVASRWAPQQMGGFSAAWPDSFEQVLAVVAVWESWTGVRIHLQLCAKSPALLVRGTFCLPDRLSDSPLHESARLDDQVRCRSARAE
jgi:hypothetical protein